jgi:hypothetical protein
MKTALVAAMAVLAIAVSAPSFAQNDNQQKATKASARQCCTAYCSKLFGASGRKYSHCLGVGHCNRSC